MAHDWMTVVAGLVLINLWTVVAFWHDKRSAQAGTRRTPESSLLGLALIGGSPGALAARRWFNHKTKKEPFSSQLMIIAIAQVGALIGWTFLA